MTKFKLAEENRNKVQTQTSMEMREINELKEAEIQENRLMQQYLEVSIGG